MTLLVVARAAAIAAIWRLEPAPLDPPTWRLVDTPAVHVGVRAAAANEGAALTVQLSLRTPW